MPTGNPSRRARVAAIAATADYNPEEAAVAQAMLDRMPRDLDAIATDIKAEYGKGIEAQFAIGRLLSEARALFPGREGDIEFGRWFKAQQFPFGQTTAWLLRSGAEREADVRAYLMEYSITSGRDIGVPWAVKLLDGSASRQRPPTVTSEEATPADPAFASLRDAYNTVLGVVEGEPTVNGFLSMHADDLVKSAGYIKALAAAYNEARSARQ